MSIPMPAEAACELHQTAELPVTLIGNRPMIPISIAGHDMEMLFDTAAGATYIWGSSARELNLEVRPIKESMNVYGAGGADTILGLVSVKDFKLAGLTIPKISLYEAGRWTMPKNDAGVLGEDFLYKYDLEIDLRLRKVRLFLPKGCKGDQVVYWANTYSMAKLVRSNSNDHRVQANVSLDGHAAVAIFDTGAERTVVTTQAVRQDGIGPESPQTAGAGRGPTGNTDDTSMAFVRVLTVGQETIQNTKLEIANLFASRDIEVHTGALVGHVVDVEPPDLVIGADFFLAHRVYVARSQGIIYFTYEGGPIFLPHPPEAAASSAADSVIDAGTGGH